MKRCYKKLLEKCKFSKSEAQQPVALKQQPVAVKATFKKFEKYNYDNRLSLRSNRLLISQRSKNLKIKHMTIDCCQMTTDCKSNRSKCFLDATDCPSMTIDCLCTKIEKSLFSKILSNLKHPSSIIHSIYSKYYFNKVNA